MIKVNIKVHYFGYMPSSLFLDVVFIHYKDLKNAPLVSDLLCSETSTIISYSSCS